VETTREALVGTVAESRGRKDRGSTGPVHRVALSLAFAKPGQPVNQPNPLVNPKNETRPDSDRSGASVAVSRR
jgi:hypothetical protein